MKAGGHKSCAQIRGTTGESTGGSDHQNRADVHRAFGAAWGNRTPDLFITSGFRIRVGRSEP